jgi:hypothetical protein
MALSSPLVFLTSSSAFLISSLAFLTSSLAFLTSSSLLTRFNAVLRRALSPRLAASCLYALSPAGYKASNYIVKPNRGSREGGHLSYCKGVL